MCVICDKRNTTHRWIAFFSHGDTPHIYTIPTHSRTGSPETLELRTSNGDTTRCLKWLWDCTILFVLPCTHMQTFKHFINKLKRCTQRTSNTRPEYLMESCECMCFCMYLCGIKTCALTGTSLIVAVVVSRPQSIPSLPSQNKRVVVVVVIVVNDYKPNNMTSFRTECARVHHFISCAASRRHHLHQIRKTRARMNIWRIKRIFKTDQTALFMRHIYMTGVL